MRTDRVIAGVSTTLPKSCPRSRAGYFLTKARRAARHSSSRPGDLGLSLMSVARRQQAKEPEKGSGLLLQRQLRHGSGLRSTLAACTGLCIDPLPAFDAVKLPLSLSTRYCCHPVRC